MPSHAAEQKQRSAQICKNMHLRTNLRSTAWDYTQKQLRWMEQGLGTDPLLSACKNTQTESSRPYSCVPIALTLITSVPYKNFISGIGRWKFQSYQTDRYPRYKDFDLDHPSNIHILKIIFALFHFIGTPRTIPRGQWLEVHFYCDKYLHMFKNAGPVGLLWISSQSPCCT